MGPDPRGKETPEERQARFLAWWERLTPEQRHSQIRAGHVRLKFGHVPEKARKPKKRTRAAQQRSAEVQAMRETFGEAYVHAASGSGLKALRDPIAERNAA